MAGARITPEEFRGRLGVLVKASELSLRQIADRAEISKSTLHGWLRESLPKDAGELGRVVKVCLAAAARNRSSVEVGPWTSAGRWADALALAVQHRDATPLVRPVAARPTGKPIGLWAPRELGVHDAITVRRRAPLADRTAYVERRHDMELRQILGGAERIRMVVLVGESCTGKTRALYEAISAGVDTSRRPIVRPSGPHDLLQVFEKGLPARSILWLDDCQRRFLNPTHGPVLAERLAALIADRSPRLVLADMWSRHWNDLVGEVDEGPEQEWRVHVRSLLRTSSPGAIRKIDVAPDFTNLTDDQRQALEEAGRADPRVALAIRAAKADQRLTQVLAGGTHLVERYASQLDPLSRAVITATMDAVRFWCEDPIPVEFLRRAAPGYVDDNDRVATVDWFQRALAEASVEDRGVRALRLLRQDSEPGPPDAVELHDYLLQYGQERRHSSPLPTSFWSAAVDAAPPEMSLQLWRQAYRYGLLRVAYELTLRNVDAGDQDACADMARIFAKAGRLDEALDWYERAATGGDADALVSAARRLIDADRIDDALGYFIRYTEMRPAEAGETFYSAASLLDRYGKSEAAFTTYQKAAGAGDRRAARAIIEKLMETSTRAAADWFQQWRHPGDTAIFSTLAFGFSREGRAEEALPWWQLTAEAIIEEDKGKSNKRQQPPEPTQRNAAQSDVYTMMRSNHLSRKRGALGEAVRIMVEAGRLPEALTWLQRLVRRGADAALCRALELLGSANRHDERVEWCLELAKAGARYGYLRAADLREKEGRLEEALRLYRLAASAQPSADSVLDVERYQAIRGAVDILRRLGRAETAHQWLLRLADSEDLDAINLLAREAARAGLRDVAIDWFERASAAGDGMAEERVVTTLIEDGRLDDAMGRAETAAELDEPVYEALTAALVDRDRKAEALALLHRKGLAGDWTARSLLANEMVLLGRFSEASMIFDDTGPITASQFAVMIEEEAGRTDTLDERFFPEDWKSAAYALYEQGNVDEALTALTEFPETDALQMGARFLEASGRNDEVWQWYIRFARLGNFEALFALVRSLERSGNLEAAATMSMQFSQKWHYGPVMCLAADLLVKLGRVDDAIRWYWKASNHDDDNTREQALFTLKQAGRHDESARLLAYGWDPDGTIARPWP